MRERVAAATSVRPFSTFEIVESETPASSATSASVTRSAAVSVAMFRILFAKVSG